MSYVDLHLHTTFSDGFLSPRELLNNAKRLGFSAISVTDHDTVDGVEESIKIGAELGVEVIPGIELSACFGADQVHILGYFVNIKDENLLSVLKKIKIKRVARIKNIISKINSPEVNLDYDEFLKFTGGGTVGRLHLAHYLKSKQLVTSVYDAFEKYIGKDNPAYESVDELTVKDSIDLILSSGGVPVIAHPAKSCVDRDLQIMVEFGLKGIEVYHSSHSAKDNKKYLKIAEKLGLLVTGGSDCHGKGKMELLIGNVKLPYSFVEKLKEASLNVFL